MKKFTTTFFLLMAMVLLLPTEVGAWSDVYLFSTIDGVWSSNDKTDNDKFTKTDANTFYKDIDATNITGDISFCLYVTDNNGFEIFPSINDDVITAEYEAHDSWSDGAYKENRDNRAWKIKHSSDGRDKYRILFRYDNNTRKFYVKVSDSESTVYDPVLEKEDEISCFVEVPPTINEVKIWAWNGSTNYTGSEYKNRPSLDLKGYTTNGHKIFKWTYSGKETTAPSQVVFSKGGDAEEDKFAKDIAFTNHGYYVYDGTKNIESSSDIITNVSGGETTTTTTAYIKYGDNEPIASKSTESLYVFTIPKSEYNDKSGISFALQTVKTTTTDGNTTKEYTNYTGTGLKNNSAGVAYIATTAAEGSYGANWTYTADEGKEPTGDITVTLNTTTKKVSLEHAVAGTTPVTGENYYLVGNFFPEDGDNINYDRKIFRFDSDGTGNYTLDIPATLTVDCQVIGVKDGVVTVYAPSGAYEIKGDCPNDNLAVSGTLATTTLDDASNKWSFTTRNLTSDGIYTITLSESATKWSIKHNGNKRMAYYLSTMEGATAQPSYTEEKGSLVINNNKKIYDNRYFGYVYLERGAGCYVISNLKTQQDSGNTELSKTAPKLYLQGNEDGVIGGGDGGAKVFPNGTSNITSKPFTIGNEEKALSVMLEYNPTQGDNNGKYTYDFGDGTSLSGRVQKANSTDAAGSSLPEITSMQILGPGVNGTWNAGDAYEMHYNATERCWEATFTTTKAESKENHFRFIANRKLEYNFGEVNTVARVPYLGDDATGVSALPADPNDVQYHAETDGVTHEYMTGDDIIFNRPAGVWTVKFYITQKLVGEGGKYEYDFKYTINGTPTVNVPVNLTYRVDKFIRSFSYGDNLDLPADGSVKAYEAYRFEQGDKATKKHGTVYLRRIEYIPANMGVILVGEVPEGSGTFEDGNVKAFNLTKRTAGLVDKNEDLWTLKDSYKNDANWSKWNNYLVGTVTAVNDLGNAEVVDGKVTKRYFGLGHYHATNEYKKTHDGVDYIGFFRYTANAISGAHKAYLSIPTATDSKFGYIDFNGQWLDDNYDSPNAPNDEISTLSKAGIIFDDIDFDETTAISNVNANEKNVNDGAYYTLQGIKVAKPTRGLYIHNGKKVIIK